MANTTIIVLIALLFLFLYVIVLDLAADNIYSKNQVPILAITLLVIFACVLGILNLVYYYTYYDARSVYICLIICALAALGYVIKFMRRHWEEINKTVLAFVFIFLLGIFYVTIGIRIGQDNISSWAGNTRLHPFSAVEEYMSTGATWHFIQFLQNLAAFIPFGAMVPLIYWRKFSKMGYSACFGFIISTLVEMVQFVTRLGMFDVDDIIANTAGAIIGSICCRVFMHFYTKKVQVKEY